MPRNLTSFLLKKVVFPVTLCWFLLWGLKLWGDLKGNSLSLDRLQRDNELVAYDYLLSEYPWIKRGSCIPNYYTRVPMWMRKEIGKTAVVYVHQYKAGGTTMKTCMKKVSDDINLQPMQQWSFPRAFYGYGHWPRGILRGRQHLHAGGWTFGVCNHIDKPCSYFTILRDPYDLMVSLYLEYFTGLPVKKKDGVPHTSITINKWAKSKGSHFFHQLFTDMSICYLPRFNSPGYRDFIHEQDHPTLRYEAGADLSSEEYRCWKFQRLYMEYHLNVTEKIHLLRYFLDNMENWFTVIGIVEQMDMTFTLLEDAYKLPFRDNCLSPDNTIWKLNLVESKMSSDPEQNLATIAKLKRSLLNDKGVRDALFYDIQLYNKAREIFAKQVEIYQNNHPVVRKVFKPII